MLSHAKPGLYINKISHENKYGIAFINVFLHEINR